MDVSGLISDYNDFRIPWEATSDPGNAHRFWELTAEAAYSWFPTKNHYELWVNTNYGGQENRTLALGYWDLVAFNNAYPADGEEPS